MKGYKPKKENVLKLKKYLKNKNGNKTKDSVNTERIQRK